MVSSARHDPQRSVRRESPWGDNVGERRNEQACAGRNLKDSPSHDNCFCARIKNEGTCADRPALILATAVRGSENLSNSLRMLVHFVFRSCLPKTDFRRGTDLCGSCRRLETMPGSAASSRIRKPCQDAIHLWWALGTADRGDGS